MRLFKHPIRAIREPFGTAGLIVACIALVAAVGGTAWAAAKLNSTQKKEVEKIAKKFAGKPGAPGPAGPGGAQGPPGAQGAKGDPGQQGAVGATGATGKNGTNGVTGPTGLTGPTGPSSPLASGVTETGNWAAIGGALGEEVFYPFPISYAVSLAVPSTKVVYLNLTETENSTTTPKEGCELELFSNTAKPVAPKGTLCVFTRFEETGKVINVGPNIVEESDAPAGAFVWAQTDKSGLVNLSGTWAVTAP